MAVLLQNERLGTRHSRAEGRAPPLTPNLPLQLQQHAQFRETKFAAVKSALERGVTVDHETSCLLALSLPLGDYTDEEGEGEVAVFLEHGLKSISSTWATEAGNMAEENARAKTEIGDSMERIKVATEDFQSITC